MGILEVDRVDTPERRDGTRSDLVYQDVRRRIITGELESGEPVRVEEVAARLGVSPTPAREALARLEATGLINYEPRRGFRVAPPLTPAQLEDLMDARELLQVAAARLAAQREGADFADALEDALARQERAIAALRDPDLSGDDDEAALWWEVAQAEMNFHQTVVDHTDNAFVTMMANTLAAQSHRSRHSVARGVDNLEHSMKEHRTIVRAARYGDPETVAAAMLVHLRLVRRRAREDAQDATETLAATDQDA